MLNRLTVGLVILTAVTLILIGTGIVGCAGPSATADQRMDAFNAQVRALQALGVEARIVVIWGDGHVAGQAFNMSGSTGFLEVVLTGGEGNE